MKFKRTGILISLQDHKLRLWQLHFVEKIVYTQVSIQHVTEKGKIMQNKETHDILLGGTSRWTAGVRALESTREDRLFNDPWAAVLAGTEGKEWAAHPSVDKGVSIIVRTRFFDDYFQRIISTSDIRQIVLMAAGLDTRAFRLPWHEGTKVFELDQPQVLQYKEQVLSSAGAQPTSERHTIEVDLTGPWTEALIKAGFDPQQPSAWLVEGLLPYIPSESIERIFDEITHLAAPGSWLGFDTVNSAMLTSQWTRQFVEELARSGTPWISTMDDPEDFLARRGWKATIHQMGDEETNYGRWQFPVAPLGMPDIPRSWFVTAQKQ